MTTDIHSAEEIINHVTQMNIGDVNCYKTGKKQQTPYCTAELWIGTVFVGIVSKTGISGKTTFRCLNAKISDEVFQYRNIIEAKANALGFQKIAMKSFIDLGYSVIA